MKSPHGGFFGFMNNQGGTGNPVLDQLLAKLVGSGGVTQQQTQPVKDAASYYNNTNNDIMKSVQGMIQGGSGGYAVNAGPAAKAWDSNTAATAGIPLHLAENLNNNNSQLLGNLLNAATQQQGNAMNYDVGKENANSSKLGAQVGAANSGWVPDASGNVTNNQPGSGNQRIDNYVKSVMNGYTGIGDVPSDIRPRVMSELSNKGFDPAKELWGDLNGLQGTYSQGGGLSTGNNLGSKASMGLGDLLNLVGIKTPQEQQKQLYIEASKNFANKYAGVLGKNIDLPNTNDTPEQAAKKFAALSATIRNKFYQGGNGPGAGGNNNDPLGLGF